MVNVEMDQNATTENETRLFPKMKMYATRPGAPFHRKAKLLTRDPLHVVPTNPLALLVMVVDGRR